MPNAVFLDQICKFGAPCSRRTNAKCHKKAQKRNFEYKKMSPAAGEGVGPQLPDQGLCPWTPLGALTQTPVIAMVPSILNSSLCSTRFLFLIMPCLAPPSGAMPQTHVVFALPCSPCLFLTPICFTCGVSRDFLALDIFRAGFLT